ncbi:leishmanolysin-related zinc metalloendopeptidase [Thalassotalea euphylliae]|uniref:leishmanolysin-related zinc metalloendopeptidase n=1 Tax=Thalassotalea euphylliae TaxID=1655234 RepID=UPI00363FCF0E
MKLIRKIAAVAAISLATSSTAFAGMFNISIVNGAGLTASQVAIFDSAIATWESFLIGTQDDIDVNLVIDASAPNIDGPGGILGQAGPTNGVLGTNYLYATDGIMEFDSADAQALENIGAFDDVILHEMAHVIGFGTLWTIGEFFPGYQDVYNNGSGQYTGQYGLEMYREEFDPFANFVPVELDGGPGTANGHWDEDWLGGAGDLMTGFLDIPNYITNTTLASFADIGFVVRLPDGRIIGGVEIPSPPTVVLLLTSLLFFTRKRS